MPTFIPAESSSALSSPAPDTQRVKGGLTLTQMQIYVQGFVHFMELMSGELLIVNEASLDRVGPYNKSASALAGVPVYGNAILCEPSELQ